MKAGMSISPDGLRNIVTSLRLSPAMTMALGGLGFVTLGSALFALASLWAPTIAPAPANSDWRPPSLEAENPDAARAPSEDKETLSRPIFFKNRRPPPRPAAGAARAPTSQPAEGLSLGAIIKFRDAGRALVVSTATPGGKWLETGDNIDGWTVERIEEAKLTLHNGEQTVVLKLYPDGANQRE